MYVCLCVCLYVCMYVWMDGGMDGLILAQVAILGHFKAMLGLSGVMCVKKSDFPAWELNF